jgi:hypothetical protein
MRRIFVTLCMTTLGILIAVSGVMADSIKVLDASGGPGGVVKLKFDVPGSTDLLWGYMGVGGFTPVSKGGGGASGLSEFVHGTIVAPAFKKISTGEVLTSSSFTPFLSAGLLRGGDFSFAGGLTGTIRVTSSGDTVAAVPTPEPASLFLLSGTMIVGLGFLRRGLKK